MNLWLDDIRDPVDFGRSDFVWVTNIEDAKTALQSGKIVEASLDHDLGACKDCLGGLDPNEWLIQSAFQSMPHCTHVGTGYDLCLWMAETGYWPKVPPVVHSANPVGAERMRGVIARYFSGRNSGHTVSN